MVDSLSRGVQLFFILSAFTLTLSTRERMINGTHSLLGFFLRRAFRILPLWWCAVIFYSRERSLSDGMATAFFYFGFFPTAWVIATLPVAWSLFSEEFFYFIFPFVLPWIQNLRAALVALAMSLGVSFLWIYFCQRVGIGQELHFPVIFPLHDGFAFFIGIVLAYCRPKFAEVIDSALGGRRMRVVLDLVAVLGLAWIALRPGRRLEIFFLVPVVIAAFDPRTVFGCLTRQKWLREFGVCCYSIYLWHVAILGHTFWVHAFYFRLLGISDAPLGVRILAWFVPVAGLNLLLGQISFQLLERPLVRLGARVAGRFGEVRTPVAVH